MKEKLKNRLGMLLLLAGVLFLFWIGGKGKEVIMTFVGEETKPVIVIDAGHGGNDPGKIGVSGVEEKEINLAIAKELETLLTQEGFFVVMTRTEDMGLYSENASNKKAEDLKNRCAIVKNSNPLCMVCIHQNSYTSAEQKGAQVFYYSGSAEGAHLAKAIQESMVKRLNPDNSRVETPNDTYYLLKYSVCPSVIVECGFLTNPEEEKLLVSEDYQRKVAWSIFMGIENYVNQEAADTNPI